MTDIQNKDIVKDIARHYCNNGRNKSQALISAGYSESYAKTNRGLKIYQRKPVINAIDEEDKAIRANTAYCSKKAESELDEALSVARAQGNPNAMVSAITGKCKLYALMTDKQVVEVDAGPELTLVEIDAYKELARAVKLKLSKGDTNLIEQTPPPSKGGS